jgi:hypothetical protein
VLVELELDVPEPLPVEPELDEPEPLPVELELDVPEPLLDEPEPLPVELGLDVPEPLLVEFELKVSEPELDEPELDEPELLPDELELVDEGVLACVAAAEEGDAFAPHPKALTSNRIATNKEILDIRSPGVSAAPKETLIPNDYGCSRVSA